MFVPSLYENIKTLPWNIRVESACSIGRQLSDNAPPVACGTGLVDTGIDRSRPGCADARRPNITSRSGLVDARIDRPRTGRTDARRPNITDRTGLVDTGIDHPRTGRTDACRPTCRAGLIDPAIPCGCHTGQERSHRCNNQRSENEMAPNSLGILFHRSLL
jgi:hypothetical protein